MKTLLLTLFSVYVLFANDAAVSVEWLSNHSTDKNVRVVEVSEKRSYEMGHIPGALHTAISQWRFNNGTFLSVRSPKEIQKLIRNLGIDEKSHVVLYAPVSTPKDFLKASYVFWALQYHGISNVSLLNGTQQSWIDAGHSLSQEAVHVAPSSFTVTLDTSKIADLEYVKKHIGTLPMIDARPADKYLGITPTATVRRDGHIEKAMSYSWNYSVNEDYTLKDINALKSLFSEGYGLSKDQEIIVYCTGGLETSYNYYILQGGTWL